MKSIFSTSICIIAFVIGCTPNEEKQSTNHLNPQYDSALTNLLSFFNEHAYDSTEGVYYSEIANNGDRLSDKVYNVALSRLIYGLAYTSKFYPENLDRAKQLADFQLTHMLGEDSTGLYFLSYVEIEKKDTSRTLDIWQQSYGLCGLSELYRQTKDQEMLEKIHELHDAHIKRFYDPEFKGLWGNYDLDKGPVSESKSLQSAMYPITSYLANLWLADSLSRSNYEYLIQENLAILFENGWNKETGWVNVKLNDDWHPCESDSPDEPCFTVTPGHNFQLAALFLRSNNFPFLAQEEKGKYQSLAHEILASTFSKPIFPEDQVKQGFYSEFNPINDAVKDKRKTWWQHAEALIALSLTEEYSEEFEIIKDYYFLNFSDYENGGEYFFLDEFNEPIATEAKGSIGKSIYHTTELIRFLEEKE